MTKERHLPRNASLILSALLIGAGLLFALVGFAQQSAHAETASPSRAAEAQASMTWPITGTEWMPPAPAYRVVVQEDGMYRVTHDDLSNAGLSVGSLDPRTFRMFYMGEEIPIEVTGESNGSFDPGDEIHFYALSVDTAFRKGLLPANKYTGQNVYWLSYGGPDGLRMAGKDGSGNGTPVASFMRSVWQEGNLTYFSNRPQILGLDLPERYVPGADRWYWIWLRRNTAFAGRNFPPVSIPNLTASGQDGQIVVNLLGNDAKVRLSEPDVQHHIRVRVNNNLVFEDPAAGVNFEQFTISATVPHEYFNAGSNVVRIELAGTSNEVYVNWYELTFENNLVAVNNELLFTGPAGDGPWQYTVSNFTASDKAVYDVTDPLAPMRIVNADVSDTAVSFRDEGGDRRYAATDVSRYHSPVRVQRVSYPASAYTPADLLDTDNGADWIAITHADFFTETLRLAQHRTQLYRVALIDVQQIYDQFNGGLRSAESIREFLRYTYHNWAEPRPRFVLLVGDGSYDMRNYRFPAPTYIPPFLEAVDPFLGETAADNRFVTLVGDDLLPDISIGRFPVDTVAEAALIVDKTIRYETTPTVDDWNLNVLFIADDLDGGGGNFYELSDIIADGYAGNIPLEENKFLPPPYTSTKVYLGMNCDLDSPGSSATAHECRADIIDAINQGMLFTSYVGHAQADRWAVESLMDASVISQLTNEDRLSIFLAMACYEGVFHDPNVIPLAEQYLLSSNAGAVASWSPTGYGVATGHDYLEQGFFLAVFQDGVTTMGEAADAGKLYLHNNTPPGVLEDLLDTFLVFGDPALQINVSVGPTSVDMMGFNLEPQTDGVTLHWQTANELNMVGFNILSSAQPDGPFLPVNGEMIQARWPGSAQGASYSFLDTSAQEFRWYQLEIVGMDGSRRVHGLVGGQNRIGHQIFLPGVHR